MKKRILLTICIIAMLMLALAIVSSAEAPAMYIEFGARFPGSDEYVSVYTQNAESSSNPKIDFAGSKFYSDADFTTEVDMSTATGIDFSVTKTYVNGAEGKAVTRMVKPSDPFTNCVEVKWFLEGMPTVSYNGSFFQNWTGLKYFDFGNATAINDNTFQNCGFESITIPASITSIGGSAFKDCLSLKSVKFEGTISKYNNGATFRGCTALTSVDIGPNTSIGNGMFYGCTKITDFNLEGITSIGSQAFRETSLTSLFIPKEITSIGGEAYCNCKSLTSVVFEEGFSGTLGSSAFMGTSALTTLTLVEGIKEIPSQCFWNAGSKSVIEKVTLPDSVETLKGRAFNGSTIKVLEIRETSNLKSITGDAFAGMKQMVSIYLPTGVVISCDNLFQYCHKLEKLENFENVKFNVSSYGENVFPGSTFYECLALKEIKIPNTVTAIAGTSFRYYAVEKIYIPASVTSINSGWLNDTTHMPKTATFFYCGTDANKLLSLTDDGTGVVSTRLASMIENGSVAEYKGMSATYDSGVIVYNVNGCDVYYGGIHTLDEEKSNPCAGICANCKEVQLASSPVHSYVTTINYANGYTKTGIKTQTCQNTGCAHENGYDTDVDAVVDFRGVSVKESGDALTFGYVINYNALDELVKITGKEVELGFVAGVKSFISGEVYGNENAVTASVVTWKVETEEVKNEAVYANADFILRGTWDKNVDLDGDKIAETEVKNVEFYMAGYLATNGAVSYLNASDSFLSPDVVTYNMCSSME